MQLRHARAGFVAGVLVVVACGGPQPPPAEHPAPAARVPDPSADQPDPEERDAPAPTIRSSATLMALLPSNGTGCAPGARCLRTLASGRPRPAGGSIAQCRGEMADFIVPRNTIPAGYAGPWFQPNLIENAHTGVPQGARPWRSFDPRREDQRLAYLLALRNYAFASGPVRSLSPQFTGDAGYFDPAGGSVPASQRAQNWYPAPRMMYGNPGASGSGAREAAHGMTQERRVGVGELGGNTADFRNYAVAYYDARGARTYARVWSTATPGLDTPVLARMRFANHSLVYKLLFSAAEPSDFPEDLLAGSLAVRILPNAGGTPVPVRLLQIDIAVKDERAGPTGWYFATYAFDRHAPGSSPWLKMAPVGLMWGNDPAGAPLVDSWINPAAPAYSRAHLGVDGRLNGPVDNPNSACMSCHSTAQAPSLADMVPPRAGACAAQRAAWFRNLPGTQPFGRFDPQPSGCETSLQGLTLTAADYSLQLADTVTRALTDETFNPCTWDDQAPPAPSAGPAARTPGATVFRVRRDPEQ